MSTLSIILLAIGWLLTVGSLVYYIQVLSKRSSVSPLKGTLFLVGWNAAGGVLIVLAILLSGVEPTKVGETNPAYPSIHPTVQYPDTPAPPPNRHSPMR